MPLLEILSSISWRRLVAYTAFFPLLEKDLEGNKLLSKDTVSRHPLLGESSPARGKPTRGKPPRGNPDSLFWRSLQKPPRGNPDKEKTP
jgi:hypothetical protein